MTRSGRTGRRTAVHDLDFNDSVLVFDDAKRGRKGEGRAVQGVKSMVGFHFKRAKHD